jgi:multiple sugar transport system ATP-binding protein
MTMADRIVVMRDGRISQIGAPLELYDCPANTFVAGFIGSPSMNLIEGAVVSGRFAAAGIDLLLPAVPGLTEGRKLTYGIRPEHLTLTDQGQPASVVVVEPTGSEIHLVLRTGDRELTVVVRERQAFQPGQTLHLTPMPDMIHVFDETGARIA